MKYQMQFRGRKKNTQEKMFLWQPVIEANSEEEAWEKVQEEYEAVLRVHCRPIPPRMESEEFYQTQDKLLADVPQEFRGFLTHLAWEEGHSNGYEEVLNLLKSLISDFMEALTKYNAARHNG